MPIRVIKRKSRLKGALSNFRKKSGDFKRKSQILSQIFQMSYRPYTKRIPLNRRGRGVPMRAVLTKATVDSMRSLNRSNSNRP